MCFVRLVICRETFVFAHCRRRRKRRDTQSSEGKPDRPEDFNLPKIPHCYSTAASYAASSLSYKFTDAPESMSYGTEVQSREDGGSAMRAHLHHPASMHSTGMTGGNEGARVSPRTDNPMHEQALSSPHAHNSSSSDGSADVVGVDVKQYQGHGASSTTTHHGSHQLVSNNLSPSPGGITAAVAATILPDFRPAVGQTHPDAARYSSFPHSAAPLVAPSSAQYPGHPTLGHAFSAASAPFTQAQYSPHVPSPQSSQRQFNFSVNDLIQRSYPRM